LKIKAFTIFIAWLMILAHSVIPHNHVENDCPSFYRHTHSTAHYPNQNDLPEEFYNQYEDTGICRVSSLLFHQLSQDNLLIPALKGNYFYFILQKGYVLFDKGQNLYTSNFYGSISLRSPPVT